jgi:hypothetical protein
MIKVSLQIRDREDYIYSCLYDFIELESIIVMVQEGSLIAGIMIPNRYLLDTMKMRFTLSQESF